ncbi:MAG: transporter substrate-binding domain-containing protein [bacterium]|jgi:ABC-type amino acid transport substrate-binding protein
MVRRSVSKGGMACLFAFLLAVPSVSGPASAGGLEDARSRGRLLVGVKTDSPPFGYMDRSGKPEGFDVDVARYLANAMFEEEGRLEAVPVTSGSRIPFLYSDWIDMIVATMTVTEERRQVLEFSDPYFVSASMLLVPARSGIRGIEDLAGKTVAFIEGSVQEEDLAQLAPAANRVPFKDIGEAVRALERKKADALCQDDMVILALARKTRGFKAAGKPILPRTYAIAVRKGDMTTLRWINGKLAAMRKDGSYDRLREKHFGVKSGKEGKP